MRLIKSRSGLNTERFFQRIVRLKDYGSSGTLSHDHELWEASDKRTILLSLEKAVRSSMDHLPRPEGTAALEVPYVCTEPWDNGDFFTYPERKGFDVIRLRELTFEDHTPQEFHSFLQTWLYFGFLVEAFKALAQTVHQEDFVRASAGKGKFITTEKLPWLVGTWRDQEAGALKIESFLGRIPPLEVRMQKFWSICLEVRSWAVLLADVKENLRFVRDVPDDPESLPLSPQTAMAIFAMGSTLTRTALEIHGPHELERAYPGRWGPSALLEKRLLDNGWCPKIVSYIHFQLSIECPYYFGYFPSPHENDHSKCSKLICHHDKVDQHHYRTRHVQENCRCQHVVASKQAISILKSGDIPVVSWSKPTDHAEGKLQVLAASNVRQFVAISHV